MSKINLSFIGIILLILFASFTRIIPHMPNFTPIGAMALFGGAYLSNKYHAFIIPILSLWFSDLIINNFILNYYDQFTWFYPGFIWQYATFGIIILIGYFLLKKITLKKVLISSIGSSLIFFVITNFGVWSSGSMYTLSLNGLISCFVLAVPFYKGTLLGFLFYSSFLFGVFEMSKLNKKPINI
tara:strand:- start:298 stop:849 length:552 start_codon:yes stop_codon:yes gene_type:complete